MKFVAFQLAIAEKEGKEAALRLEASFDEKDCIEENKKFLFDNMPTIKEITVLLNTSEEAVAIEGSQGPRDSSAPGNPAIFYS